LERRDERLSLLFFPSNQLWIFTSTHKLDSITQDDSKSQCFAEALGGGSGQLASSPRLWAMYHAIAVATAKRNARDWI
jgi:hypothetical protein